MPKRRTIDGAEGDEDSTPRKSRRTISGAVQSPSLHAETPSKRKSILRGTPSSAKSTNNDTGDADPTSKSLRKVLFSTPSKLVEPDEENGTETPIAVRNDRSARRKSAKALQRSAVAVDEDESGGEGDLVDLELANEILHGDGTEEKEEGGEEEHDNEDEGNLPLPSSTTATPVKRGRGRPKGSKRERTPSPPPNLPPHELYFFQNRAGGNKTSANTMPSHLLLNHEDFFKHISAYKDSHEGDIQALGSLHERAFDQWTFELDEGFNICLYGYGSKRDLAMRFAAHLYRESENKTPQIIIVNGYTPGLTMRDILRTLSQAVFPKDVKLPAQPAAMMDHLLTHLTTHPRSQNPITIFVHSLDHANLRKPATQALLARLASHHAIRLLATCDTPSFPLLWDATQQRLFRWLYHDATTFAPYTAAELDVVEECNALLGRGRRRLGGRDGVAYVLRSLPENARALFAILVAEQLALEIDGSAVAAGPPLGPYDDDDADSLLGVEDEDEAAALQNTPSRRRGRGRPPRGKGAGSSRASVPTPTSAAAPEGVEYRSLYHRAVEAFVCSSEVGFRTLLKEFYDHQMVESRKDGLGTERLVVPFAREELEGLMEELV